MPNTDLARGQAQTPVGLDYGTQPGLHAAYGQVKRAQYSKKALGAVVSSGFGWTATAIHSPSRESRLRVLQ